MDNNGKSKQTPVPPPPFPQEIHKLDPMDSKIYILERTHDATAEKVS